MSDHAQRGRDRADRALFDTPARAAMNAHRSPVRDGQDCDQCGLPNFPAGWIHGGWTTYIDYPDSSSEGFGGLVLCALCYVEHVAAADGSGRAFDVLNQILRAHQQRVVRSRAQVAQRRAAAAADTAQCAAHGDHQDFRNNRSSLETPAARPGDLP